MYTLIGHPRARTGRVMWMLEELEEDYRLVPSLPHAEDVRALNPSGKIPILLDGDAVLIESIAICQYLADKHAALTFPAGSLARARQDAFTQMIGEAVESALWTTAKHSFVLPEGKRVPAIKPVAAWELARALEHLEQLMDDGPYLMGNIFTVPDVLMGHAAAWARLAKLDLPGGKLGAYLERIEHRPACAKARERAAAIA